MSVCMSFKQLQTTFEHYLVLQISYVKYQIESNKAIRYYCFVLLVMYISLESTF